PAPATHSHIIRTLSPQNQQHSEQSVLHERQAAEAGTVMGKPREKKERRALLNEGEDNE
ncbi:hypothetical protein NDU88_000096, partial [Pleurodeles waltl]